MLEFLKDPDAEEAAASAATKSRKPEKATLIFYSSDPLLANSELRSLFIE